MTHTAPQVFIVDKGGVRTASVTGELDVFNAAMLAPRLLAGLPRETTELVVDLAAVSAVDSAGISALVRMRDHARARGFELCMHFGADSQLTPTAHSVLQGLLPFDDEVDLATFERSTLAAKG